MNLFSFHLATVTPAAAVAALCRPPAKKNVPGLRHAECLATMTLGAPIFSSARIQLHTLAVFASWDNERSLEAFLADTKLGHTLSAGWHVRLAFLRRWGHVAEFDDLPVNMEDTDPSRPVVAVTLARLKLTQLPRFIRWGRPVEQLVHDHPGTTLALAAVRPPRTFCTFSVWRSRREMEDMVHGRDAEPGSDRHAKAMNERTRKEFHHAFTTLRFRPLSEHGEWLGRGDYVPS